jgi:hypothetical protein
MHHLTQLIKQPTRVTNNSSTLIDVIAVNNESIAADSGTLRQILLTIPLFIVSSREKLGNQKFFTKNLDHLSTLKPLLFKVISRVSHGM